MKFKEWFWRLLPDTCEIDDCCRKGVRGNENRIYPFPESEEFFIVVCDYCNSKYMSGEVLKLDGISSRLIVKEGAQIVDFKYRRRKHAVNKTRKG